MYLPIEFDQMNTTRLPLSLMTFCNIKIFRNKEDIIPTCLIVGLFFADIFVFAVAQNVWILLLWLILVIVPKVCICSWNHHHQHLHTFYNTTLNRLLELVYSFHTGVTTNAWVLHHNLGHHLNYLDQERDESAWKRKNGTMMGEWEYTAVNALKAYFRAFRVGLRHPKYQKGFLTMGFLVLVLLSSAFYYNWLNALFVFFIPMFWGYMVTVWHTYSHHAGLDTKNHYEASHNILHRWYNIMTGNLGYHTAHHVKPGLHWSQLPKFHASIADKIPKELFLDPPIPFKWFPKGDAKYSEN